MTHHDLPRRVDLSKLTGNDFLLQGEFRVLDEGYNGWNGKPEFRKRGMNEYVHFDSLFPLDKLESCYEMIVQTPESSRVIQGGYLHLDKGNNICLGIRETICGVKRYSGSLPVWFSLTSLNNKPIVEGEFDLILLKTSPWDNEKDSLREKVLEK